MSKRLAVSAVTVALSALALSACSSGSSSGSSGAASVPSPPATTAADVALARSELLPPSGFPSGWQSQGAGSENSQASFFGGMSDSEVRLVTSCLGTSTAQVDTAPAEATDPHYSDPNSSVGVSDTVDVFPSAAAAQFDVSMAANPKLPACFEKLAPRFESGAPKGVHFGRLSAHRGAVPALGDKDASLSASVPFTYQGSSGTLYVEVVMIEKGRSESNLLFVGENSAPDQALVDQVASAAAATLTSS